MAEANTSSTQQAADAQHVDNMTSMQQSTPDAPSGARSDAPVQTNNVGTQDGPSQLNSNPTGNSTNNNNLGGGQQNSTINGGSSGNLGGAQGPGGGDAGGAGGALNGLAGNLGGAGNAGGEAGQGGAGNAGGGSGGSGGVGGGGAGNAGAVAGAGAGARGAGGVGGGGAGDAGGGEASANGTSAGGGEGGGGSAPPATASAPTNPANTTIPFDALTAEELAIAAIEANDESISSGQPINTVIEAGGLNNAIAGTPSVSNTLISADGSAFNAVTTAAVSALGFGTYTMGADGTWNYTLDNDNAVVQALNEGDRLTDTFTVTTIDGAQEVVTLRITGANDSAVISGVSSGAVEEAGGVKNDIPGTPSASGDLNSVDIDNPNTFTAVIAPLNSTLGYGTYTLSADGTWNYTLNNSNATVQALNEGDSLTDTFTVSTIDGTQQVVTITIAGDNDNAVISGVTSAVLENSIYTATGTLISADVDNIDNRFIAQSILGSNGHGNFTLNADGTWSYLQNSSTPFLAKSNTDSFVAKAIDGTEQIVTVNQFSGSQGALSQFTFGQIAIYPTDYDHDAIYDYGFSPVINAAGNHGQLNIVHNGEWQYTLMVSPAAISSGGLEDSFRLEFNYSVDNLPYTGYVDFTVKVANGSMPGQYIYTAEAAYSVDSADNLASNYSLNAFPPSLDTLSVDDRVNLLAQGVMEGVTAVSSSAEGNLGTLVVDDYGNYTYSINQVPVDSNGRYTYATPVSYDTTILYDFTNIFYQNLNQNHVDTFNVMRNGVSSTASVYIDNTIIDTVIIDNSSSKDFALMKVEGSLRLDSGSQNVSIISGGIRDPNFYASNIGNLTITFDADSNTYTYSYEISADAVGAWEPTIVSYVDTFLVSSTVGNTIHIQALEFNILQESQTILMDALPLAEDGNNPYQANVFLYNSDSIYSSPPSSNIRTIDYFDPEYDRINIAKLLTSSTDLLSGTIYIDPTGLNSRSEISINRQGTDFTVASVRGVEASIPELMWNETSDVASRSAPVTSLNAITSWTETLEISGVSYNSDSKTFSDGDGWTMKIVSGAPITGGDGSLVFGDKAGEVTFTSYDGIIHDISHVDKINWTAA